MVWVHCIRDLGFAGFWVQGFGFMSQSVGVKVKSFELVDRV
jgi:hypothetical protein